MRTATIVSLGASAALGVGALIVAKVWLPQSNHAATAGRPAASGPMTPVVVAKGAIPYGAKLDASKLQVTELPAGAAPEGAYSSIAEVVNQTGGAPIVLTPIVAREPVLASQLSGPGAKSTLAARISDGMRAYTVGVNDVAGVGGHVVPGDHVDVVLTYDLVNSGAPNNGKHLITTVVAQDLRVLGIDLNADPSSTQAAVAHTATLEVSVQDAERLALAAQAGTLSLALRRTGGAEVAPVRIVNLADVTFAGAQNSPIKPRVVVVAVRHRPPPLIEALPEARSIVVVHGDARTSVDVPADRGSGV